MTTAANFIFIVVNEGTCKRERRKDPCEKQAYSKLLEVNTIMLITTRSIPVDFFLDGQPLNPVPK
jgi:hypothetical protein